MNRARILICIATILIAKQASAQQYTLTDLGTLQGGTLSNALAINAVGQVVGGANTATGATHAFLYTNGAMTDLGTLPGGTTSIANAINSAGEITGQSNTASGDVHAFLLSERNAR